MPLYRPFGSTVGTITEGNDNRLSTAQVVNVKLNPGAGEFSSVAAALASITDASMTKPYAIHVGAGLFAEPQLVLQPYISIIGSSPQSSILVATNPNESFILGADNASLENLVLTGATGINGVLVQYTALLNDTSFLIKDCVFGDSTTLCYCLGGSVVTDFYVQNCISSSGITCTTGFLIDGTSDQRTRYILQNIILNCGSSVSPISDYVKAHGGGAKVCVESSFFIGPFSASSGNGFNIYDGADVAIIGSNFINMNKWVWVQNIGAAPELDISGCHTDTNNTDIKIDHAGTTGSISTVFETENSTIVSPLVAIFAADPTDGITFTGNLSFGPTFNTRTDVTDLMLESPTMGLFSGGVLTVGSGFTVNIAAGTGYFSTGQPDTYWVWTDTSITLTANTSNYIYFNDSGILTAAASFPDTRSSILLGRVVTNSTGIEFIDASPLVGHHYGNTNDNFVREAIGPVFQIGCEVTEDAIPLHLDVSGGTYYFGNNMFEPSANTNINFDTFYRNGSGGYVIGTANVVDTNYYDNGSGTLAPIPSGQYVRHTLYIVGDGANQKYLFVYAQTTYPTLVQAQNGNIPAAPSFLDDGVVLLASIIVLQGSTSIIVGGGSILDNRPVIGFSAPQATAQLVHGNLLGLAADDHKQYLLDNGSRAMSGNLDMGGNSIVDTSTLTLTGSSLTALTVDSTVLVVDSVNDAVGINVAPATSAVLDIVNNSGSTKAVQVTGYGSNVGFRGRYANGTLVSPTGVLSGNTLEFISGRGYGTTGFAIASTGAINIVARENFTDSTMATSINFNVTPTGSVTSVTQMVLNSTGHLLLGTTTDNGVDELQVNGSIGTIMGKATFTINGSIANAIIGAAGGAVTLAGGIGTSTGSGGNGGAINLTGGNGNGDNSVNRPGGAINLIAGSSFGGAIGGAVNIFSGVGGPGVSSVNGGNGGAITITSGTGGVGTTSSGNGGGLSLSGGIGAAGAAGGAGGGVTITGGVGGIGSTTTGGAGGGLTLNGGAGAAGVTNSGNGGGVAINGSNGGTGGVGTGGNGGAIILTAGSGSSVGVGGSGANITLNAGNAGGNNTTNNSGGNVGLIAGSSNGNSTGGAINITSGVGGAGIGAAGAAGGAITITGGVGGIGSATSGNGAPINITAGTGGAGTAGGNGGTLTITAGTGGGSSTPGNGGALTLAGGAANAGNAGSNGGAVTISGASGTTTGTGGSAGGVTINGGSAGGNSTVNQTGGNITLNAGTSKGSATGGTITLNGGTGGAGTGTAGVNGGLVQISGGTGGNGSSTNGNGGGLSLRGGIGGGSPATGGAISFYTAPVATYGNAKMTLAVTGDLLIGTLTDNGTDLLQVNGTVSYVSNSVLGTGSGSNGFTQFANNPGTPATPTSSFRLYSNSTGNLSWITTSGFASTLSTTANTAARTYTLPDASGNVVLDTATQTLTNKTISGASNTITNVSLTTGVTGTLPIANGGTNAITAAAAYNNLSPMTTTGDIEYESATGVASRLPIGSTNQVLLVNAGVPVWAANSGGTTGVSSILMFGDGSDGNVTVASGTTTLTRDMYYNNLTINGTGSINTAGYRIFVAGTLDITAAPVNAITYAGANGGNGGAGGSAGGAGGVRTGVTVGSGNAGGAGAAGAVGNGAAGTAGTAGNNGGANGATLAAGAGSSGTAGAAGAATAVTNTLPFRRFGTDLLRGVVMLLSGTSGRGGSAGGGSGTVAGGGGGGGGSSAGVIYISASTINRGASTTVGAINGQGGAGGNGGSPAAAGTGGGAGGSGAGGGWVYIAYGTLSGATGTNIIDVTGGNGGTGGTGTSTGTGGGGGGSGSGGRVTLVNIIGNSATDTTFSNAVAGTAGSGVTGGAGATATSSQVSL